MVEVRLEISDGSVWQGIDLYPDESISYTRRFNDIADFATVGNFSRDFRVPATDSNVAFFGPIFNVNLSGWFDFRRKASARLFVDTVLIAGGFIQVRKVFRQGERYAEFETVFYSEMPNLAKSIGDTKLADLTDLDTLNTALEYASLEDSVDETLESGNVIYTLLDRGQNFSQNGESNTRPVYDENNPLYIADFTPCVNALWIFQTIIEQAGFYYEGSEIDTELEKYWVPWLNQRFTKTDVTPESELFRLGIDSDLAGQNLPLTITASFDENFDNGGNVAGGVFTAPHTGYYKFQAWCHIQRTAGSGTSFVNIVLLRNDLEVVELFGSAGQSIGSNGVIVAIWYEAEALLAQGDTVKFRIKSADTASTFTVESSATYDPNVGTGWQLVSCGDPLQDATVDMVLNAPDMKQIDFIRSIISLHNLVIVPDNSSPTKVLIQPMVDYLASGTQIDWTPKLDLSKDVTVYPTTDLQKRTLEWTYAQDSDFGNVLYQEQGKRVYGRQRFDDTGSDFAAGDGKVELAFAATPCSNIPGTQIICPKFIGKDGQFITPKPRLLYRGGTQTGVKVYDFDTTTVEDTEVVLLSHYQTIDAEVDTNDLNFGMESPLHAVTGTPNNTMYNRYWRNYVRGIYGGMGADDLFDAPFIMEAYFNLTINDIYEVSFADEIWIIDSWWRVLEITDFVVGGNMTTKVKLIKRLDVQAECAWTPYQSGTGGLITFLSSDGVTTGDGTQACCELYGYVWNSGTSKCYAQNNGAVPQVPKPIAYPGDPSGGEGMILLPVTNILATYTVGAFDVTIKADATAGAITVNLPDAQLYPGRILTVIKTDAGASAVTLDGNGAQTINGAGTLALPARWDKTMVQSDGNNWIVI